MCRTNHDRMLFAHSGKRQLHTLRKLSRPIVGVSVEPFLHETDRMVAM